MGSTWGRPVNSILTQSPWPKARRTSQSQLRAPRSPASLLRRPLPPRRPLSVVSTRTRSARSAPTLRSTCRRPSPSRARPGCNPVPLTSSTPTPAMDRRNCSTDDRRCELRLRRLPAADGRLPLPLPSLSLSNQYADAGGNGDDNGESESAATAVAFAGDSERGGIRSAPAPLAPMPTVAGDSGAASSTAVALPSLPDFVEAVGLKGALTNGLACRLVFADA